MSHPRENFNAIEALSSYHQGVTILGVERLVAAENEGGDTDKSEPLPHKIMVDTGERSFKNKENKIVLQEIYDFNFRQLELSIREIGYGDQSINKKMKDYINLFHSMVSEIHFWEKLSQSDKGKKISIFLNDFNNIDYLLEYFDDFYDKLSKKTLNSYLKSVSKP